MRRRSGWPANVIPNMSNTSRSCQSAPGQRAVDARHLRGRPVGAVGRDADVLVRGRGEDVVDDREPRARVDAPVDRGHVGQHVEAVVGLERPQGAAPARARARSAPGGPGSRGRSRPRSLPFSAATASSGCGHQADRSLLADGSRFTFSCSLIRASSSASGRGGHPLT